MANSIRLIVGLGNPGSQYATTRHNVGQWFINNLAESCVATFKQEKKFKGCLTEVNLNQSGCHLLFPTTFMNCSGEAVQAVANFYKILPEQILVVHDDLDLPVGAIRLKYGGGHGGHNGLRNIIDHLHSRDFYRLRIGIGHPRGRCEVIDYVLNKPKLEDKIEMLRAIDHGIQLLPEIITGNMHQVMQELNTKDNS